MLFLLLLAAAPPDPASIKAPDTIAVCDQLYEQWPEAKAPFYCYFKFARKHLKWKEAAARLEQLRRKRPDNPQLLFTLAQIYDSGFNRSGLELRLKAAEGFGRRGQLSQQAEALTAASEDFDSAGRFTEGLQALERAEKIAGAAGDEERVAVARVWRAKHALALDDYGLAASLLRTEKADPDYPKAAPWFRWSVLNNLAAALSAMGKHREAFDLQRQRVEETAAIPYMQAAARHSAAVEAVRLADEGDLEGEEADRLVREALEAEIAAGARSYSRDGELRTRVLLARRLGATKEGLEQIGKALALEHEFQPDPAQRASALRLLARMRMDADRANAPEALKLVDESLAIARSVSSRESEAAGLLARADVEFRGGAREAAVRDALQALDALERIRDRQPEEMVRAFAGAERAWAFELVAGWLLDPARGGASNADLELSLQVLERLRAATLVESLDAAKSAGSARRDKALQRIVALQRDLSRPGLTPEARAKEHAELERAEREEEAARDELARKAPASRKKIAPPALRELQAALGADEALLAFQIFSRRTTDDAPYDDGSSWVIAVSRTAARAFRIPDARQLAAAAALFTALIARRDGSERDGAAKLHADLLAAPLAFLGPSVTKLLLVPDGPLQRLPFEALRDGAPLAVRYQIALAPSAGLWLRFRRARPAPARKPVLVLADPETSGAALRHGREEASAAIDSLGGGTKLTGASASERALKSLDLRSYAMVHFAAHAIVDEERPERSAILLAPGGPGEDGLLQMREVSALSLDGRAVVLAACSSSRGAVLPGEGVLSLGRAFFQAGAHTVLGTLWPLRDDESAAFYSAFYRSLGTGASLGAAFAAARRERIAAGDPTAAWAGHVLLGDDSTAVK